jgi:hypothetical protein
MLQQWRRSTHCITGKVLAFPEDYFPASAKPGCSLQAKRSVACIINHLWSRVITVPPIKKCIRVSLKPLPILHFRRGLCPHKPL